MKYYKNKVAVITGAASGIGKAVSLSLGKSGASVLVVDIDEPGARKVAKEITAHGGYAYPERLDVTDEKAFSALLNRCIDTYGRLDYIFNNAGIGIAGEVRDMPKKDWKDTIEINQMGVLHGTLTAYDIMLKQGFGHIINTASVAGLVPTPLLTAYSMTKHAVVGLSLSLREEAAALGVKVSVVCPGLVKTNIVRSESLRAISINNPFDFIEAKTRIKPISSTEAATHILRGVRRNQAQIVFPSHGKMMVAAYQYTRTLWGKGNAWSLKDIRANFRV